MLPINIASEERTQRIQNRFQFLYGNQAEAMMERLLATIGRYGVGSKPSPAGQLWSEKDIVLITYGDMVTRRGEEEPLQTLKSFCTKYLKGAISTVHILPFYPWSSDDGFSVRDYRKVDPDLGDWRNVREFAKEFKLQFDLVLNHCSAKSEWFRDFVGGIQPASDYFITEDPRKDLSLVVRPRTSPLLTAYATRDGEKWVWTTFSADQVDLNWKNPDLFFEFVDILFTFLSHGASTLRLDAVAFLWKKSGTNCMHLPETHEVVKLIRDILEWVAPHCLILTETNVPHKENLSYFGEGDEAHMVYQFALPPLLAHGLLRGTAEHLTNWANSLPQLESNQSFFNFTASHDGIGVRPVVGLLPAEEIDAMVVAVKDKGGMVSSKTNSDGSTSPYELNITYPALLGDELQPEMGLRRFICSQALTLSLQGMPAVYFNSLLGSPNYDEGVKRTGQNRTINRRKWDWDSLVGSLAEKSSVNAVFQTYLQMLRKRAAQPAFHPNAEQKVHSIRKDVFVLERINPVHGQRILCLFNFLSQPITFREFNRIDGLKEKTRFQDVLTGKNNKPYKRGILMAPYQALWLVCKEE